MRDNRLVPTRRQVDQTDFTQCPRYLRYELTPDQLDEITKRIYEKAKKDAAVEFSGYVISIGKNILSTLFFLVGSLGLAIATWLHYANK
jgi:hypothetical protein